MKKTKIIIPALAVLLLSTAASVSGTVAWFSMNNQVTVTGMTVQTKVSSNLLIAAVNREENYSDSIEQARGGILEPASTVDGQAFFYTTNAKGDGDAKTDNYTRYSEAAVSNADNPATPEVENNYSNALGAIDGEGAANASDATKTGKSNYDINFDKAYGFVGYDATANSGKGNGDVCFAYMDYSFYIKATSASDDQVLYMSKCNLTYSNAEGTAYNAVQENDYAWRVALLSKTAAINTDADDTELSVKSILGLANSKNQNQKADASVAPQAVASTSTLGAVSNPGAAAQARTDLDKGQTYYTKIIVRLWLEGEDLTCTSTTYANLTKNWKLTLEFKLGNAQDGNPAVDNGVKLISSNPALDQ